MNEVNNFHALRRPATLAEARGAQHIKERSDYETT